MSYLSYFVYSCLFCIVGIGWFCIYASNFDMKNYNKIHKKITSIINKEDPMGLLRIGAPKDEYESEIDDIVEAILSKKVVNYLFILDLFESWFYKDCISRETAKRISTNIKKCHFDII